MKIYVLLNIIFGPKLPWLLHKAVPLKMYRMCFGAKIMKTIVYYHLNYCLIYEHIFGGKMHNTWSLNSYNAMDKFSR